MQQLLVTDYHTAESFQHFSMKKEDIFLADAGYGTAKNYAYAMEQQAIQMERYFYEKGEKGQGKGNLWNVSQYSFLKIKGLLELSWVLFADEENETVKPYFIGKKRRRSNQNEEFHRNILSSLIS